MTWVENILIILGISLDTFGAMECQGSLIAKVKKSRLCLLCLLSALWQTLALYAGNILAGMLCKGKIAPNEIFLGHVLAAFIFFCLGLRLVAKAVKNERIQERREENLEFGAFLRAAAAASLSTFLAGLAFGFLGTCVGMVLVMLVCITAAVVVLGTYTGYHFGFEQKSKAYMAGAIILFLAGIDVVIKYIL